MMEALSSSETWVPTRATQRNFPEDAILLKFSDLAERIYNEMPLYVNIPQSTH
jgi:hypothetical protein